MSTFQQNERWLNGPAFLLEKEDKWPKTKLNAVPVTSLEVKKETYVIEIESTGPLHDISEEVKGLKKGLKVKSSRLARLKPTVLDKEGIIRISRAPIS